VEQARKMTRRAGQSGKHKPTVDLSRKTRTPKAPKGPKRKGGY
jgi:hypothetical protein